MDRFLYGHMDKIIAVIDDDLSVSIVFDPLFTIHLKDKLVMVISCQISFSSSPKGEEIDVA